MGGGLLTLLRKSLIFEKLQEITKEGTETSSVRVRMDKDKWITITNVYVPPANTTNNVKFCTDIIPALDNSLICGDFNAHSFLWDHNQPNDVRGSVLEDWCAEKELNILNSGEPTRHNRKSGNGSAPDVSLCGKQWFSACEWSVDEDLGSDHLPIIITVNNHTKHQAVQGVRTRWRSNGVDWAQYGQGVEDSSQQNFAVTDRIRYRPLPLTTD